jgi:hypothetical protein
MRVGCTPCMIQLVGLIGTQRSFGMPPVNCKRVPACEERPQLTCSSTCHVGCLGAALGKRPGGSIRGTSYGSRGHCRSVGDCDTLASSVFCANSFGCITIHSDCGLAIQGHGGGEVTILGAGAIPHSGRDCDGEAVAHWPANATVAGDRGTTSSCGHQAAMNINKAGMIRACSSFIVGTVPAASSQLRHSWQLQWRRPKGYVKSWSPKNKQGQSQAQATKLSHKGNLLVPGEASMKQRGVGVMCTDSIVLPNGFDVIV